jgi:hypothetical protein
MDLTMTHKVVAGAITALLCWVAWTTQNTSQDVAVLSAKLTAATEDRYRAADAARDLALRDERINTLSQRLMELERADP